MKIITDIYKITIRKGTRFVRESDNKIFTCTYVSHWSDIVSEDGETDSVKWLGDHWYVGTRNTYCVLED